MNRENVKKAHISKLAHTEKELVSTVAESLIQAQCETNINQISCETWRDGGEKCMLILLPDLLHSLPSTFCNSWCRSGLGPNLCYKNSKGIHSLFQNYKSINFLLFFNLIFLVNIKTIFCSFFHLGALHIFGEKCSQMSL